jgi:tRNA modification GTPase
VRQFFNKKDDTIVALSTAPGVGAIAVVRLSGPQAFSLVEQVFSSRSGFKTKQVKSHTIHLGEIKGDESVLDEVLVSIFKNPNSYTGEDVVEISCHGSVFIQQQILQLFIDKGARLAEPGEFTIRAFFNGKMDLSQAEAVGDLIASQSAVAHDVAMKQMRGGFSNQIKELRQKLIDFASLLELELDFSEEDVEFANREQLKNLLNKMVVVTGKLVKSFKFGNVIKNGIPVVIAGRPNVGKSTLLNVLLNEERAIVSEIAGTTRDTIEDEIIIEGFHFRFIDTAGIRKATEDSIEAIGIKRTLQKLKQSAIVIYLFDVHEVTVHELDDTLTEVKEVMSGSDAKLILVANKIDIEDKKYVTHEFEKYPEIIFLSARNHINIEELKDRLLEIVKSRAAGIGDTIVTSARHAEALQKAEVAMKRVLEGIENNLTTDLLALELRLALSHLGEITGEISTEELLGNIFSRFCIGK